MICDRCLDSSDIPVNPLTGEPIRCDCFAVPGRPVVWPRALLCKRCWWALAQDDHEARR